MGNRDLQLVGQGSGGAHLLVCDFASLYLSMGPSYTSAQDAWDTRALGVPGVPPNLRPGPTSQMELVAAQRHRVQEEEVVRLQPGVFSSGLSLAGAGGWCFSCAESLVLSCGEP